MPNQGSPGPGLCRSIRGSLLSARNPYGPGEQAGAGLSAFEGAPLVVGQSAPDSRLLTALDGPFQTGVNDLAATADGLCVLDLAKRRAGVPDREEQLRVLVQAVSGSAFAPRHQSQSP
jgi:hypothetical protein